MSHFKERREKNCLNCNAEVQGRYCHICGQENVDTYETAWHLVTHFFQDITHYDGKFFSTVKYLLTKPGFLTKEYINGRRASYLNPIRMYVFTSALFFLVFFSISDLKKDKVDTLYNGKSSSEIAKMDSAAFSKFTSALQGGVPMTRNQFEMYKDSVRIKAGIHFTSGRYKSRQEYDSLLQHGRKKHNWIERQLIYKELDINKKYDSDSKSIMNSFVNTLIHTFPQLLFVSLPLFAFLLHLLYIRQNKYFFANHAIFGLHFYIFFFMQLLVLILLVKVKDMLNWQWMNYINVFISVYIFYYLYKAMRVVYEQRRGKTIVKFLLLGLAHFIVMMLLLLIFVFFSLFKL